MKVSLDKLNATIRQIEQLGYETKLECTNPKKTQKVQQLHVYKNEKCIAKVSLISACRLDTMYNAVGRDERPLLEILYKLSFQI